MVGEGGTNIPVQVQYSSDSPFVRLLSTKYDPEREDEALDILARHPGLATLECSGPDEDGQPFVAGATVLHYAANDGKVRLVERLIGLGADVNASRAAWYRSVLSWAANNARVEVIRLLLRSGAAAESLDALHAAAWGGSQRGVGREEDYRAAPELLVSAGADIDDRRNATRQTPLAIAIESGHRVAIEVLRSLGASET